jgi:hypothetical protein
MKSCSAREVQGGSRPIGARTSSCDACGPVGPWSACCLGCPRLLSLVRPLRQSCLTQRRGGILRRPLKRTPALPPCSITGHRPPVSPASSGVHGTVGRLSRTPACGEALIPSRPHETGTTGFGTHFLRGPKIFAGFFPVDGSEVRRIEAQDRRRVWFDALRGLSAGCLQ